MLLRSKHQCLDTRARDRVWLHGWYTSKQLCLETCVSSNIFLLTMLGQHYIHPNPYQASGWSVSHSRQPPTSILFLGCFKTIFPSPMVHCWTHCLGWHLLLVNLMLLHIYIHLSSCKVMIALGAKWKTRYTMLKPRLDWTPKKIYIDYETFHRFNMRHLWWFQVVYQELIVILLTKFKYDMFRCIEIPFKLLHIKNHQIWIHLITLHLLNIKSDNFSSISLVNNNNNQDYCERGMLHPW